MASSDHKKTPLAQLGVIAGFVGSLSVLAIFIALYSGWVFGRGLVTALGFPTSLIGFQSSLERFPGLAIASTILFVVALSAGFYPIKFKPKVGLILASIAVFVLTFFPALGLDHGLVFLIYAALTLLSPALLGYILQYISKWQLKVLAGVFITMLILSIHTDYLFFLGKEYGLDILTKSSGSRKLAGAAIFRLEDYPIVSIISTEKLMFKTPAAPQDKGYLYESQENNFIRLVFMDEETYYFAENYSDNHMSMAIPKSVITQIQFIKIK
jgi:hypothetical protein